MHICRAGLVDGRLDDAEVKCTFCREIMKHQVEIVTSTGMLFRRKVVQMFWSSQYILNYSNLFFLSEIAASFRVVSGRWISHPDSHPERLRLSRRHPSGMEISATFMMFNFATSVVE